MRIDLNFGNLESVHSGNAKRTGDAAKELPTDLRQDEAVLSLADASISKLTATALSAPEVRAERVSELRSAINEGSYKVQPRAIASAILNDLF